MKEKHEHKYTIKIMRIRADNPGYKGTTGDKAFLFRDCKCGHKQTFDMGPVLKMAQRHKWLTGSDGVE
jgi:hypothetical protein